MKKFMYVGSSRPFGLPIRRNTILDGNPEAIFPELAGFFGQYKNFSRLFVPIDQLAQARAALKLPGSVLSATVAEIKKASDKVKAAKGI